MILRRLALNLRTQNWTAIGIEFVLLILGVYLGILAANWNQQRIERRETERLLVQLDAELASYRRFMDSIERYYEVTGRYGQVALRGWRGDPAVSDRDFVIAAYQSTQINGAGNNTEVWAAIFGMERLRNLKDPRLRENLARLMTFDNSLINLSAVTSVYRQEVRKILPDEIQSAIRAACGDRSLPDNSGLALPQTCNIDLPPDAVADAARALRARPDLASELNWHRAGIATQMDNIRAMRFFVVNTEQRRKAQR